MTHSPSLTVADRPPAMYRRATSVIVVSSTSMKVGTTTIAATTQGLPPACDRESIASVIYRRLTGLRPNRWPAIAACSLEETSRHRVRRAAYRDRRMEQPKYRGTEASCQGRILQARFGPAAAGRF